MQSSNVVKKYVYYHKTVIQRWVLLDFADHLFVIESIKFAWLWLLHKDKNTTFICKSCICKSFNQFFCYWRFAIP